MDMLIRSSFFDHSQYENPKSISAVICTIDYVDEITQKDN